MSNRQVFYFLLLVLFAVFLLSVTWEFMLEDTIGTVLGIDIAEEPAKQKWIYVFGGVFVAGVAVIGPLLLLQKSATARKRAEELLPSAVENLQECFALFDADDRLIMCNERYRQTHPLGAEFFKPGIKFEDIVRANIRKGNLPDVVGREEEYFRERMERHLNPGKAFVRRYVNGRSYLFNEAATPDGGICVTMTDITEIKEAEEKIRKLNTQLETQIDQRTQDLHDVNRANRLLRKVAIAANEAATVEAAVQVCLDEVCDFTGWPVGHAFRVTGPNRIDSMKIWHLDDPEKFEAFRKVTHGAHFVSGGLSGKALDTGQPYWVKDVGQDKSFQRGQLAANLGVKAGFAFPVLIGKEVVAVLEFYSMEAADPDQALLDVMAQVGTQLGRVVERERANGAVRDSEQRFKDIAESAFDWFWEMNADLRFSYVSDRYEELTGYPPDKLLGRTRREIWTARYPDLDERIEAHLRDLEAHKPHRDFEYEWKSPDGKLYIVRHAGKPIYDSEGNFAGYRGTGKMVTREVLAERQAAEARGQFLDAMEGVADGMALYDANDRFVLCNNIYKTKFAPIGHLLEPGTPFVDIIRAAAKTCYAAEVVDVDQFVKDRLAKRGDSQGSFQQQLVDGTWLLVREHETRDGGTLILLTDITEIKKAEQAVIRAKEEAELANRTKSEFLANISHELRTPLNAIIGFSDTIREQIFGPVANKKYEEYVENIYESGQHLLELINDILDVSAIEAGKIDLDEKDLNLADVARASVGLVRARAEKGRIRIVNDIGYDIPQLHADERRIKQILLNLLSNAVKFTPEKGEIKLTARVGDDGCILLTVSDTGVGMDQDDIARALVPFGRADSAIARTQEGTGLGLPVTRGLVEAHGGIFRMVSAPGSGTTVTIRFPPERVIEKVKGPELVSES